VSDNTAASKARLSTDQRFRLISQGIDGFVAIVRTVIWAGLGAFSVYFAHAVLIEYAGKSTLADLAFRLVVDLRLDVALAYMFGAGGVGYALYERRLRRRNIARLTARNQELELRIDPERSSSGLTPRGTTHPKDR
jgi:hypothetical protein